MYCIIILVYSAVSIRSL